MVAGETVADGMREVHEELGLEASASDLVFVGQRQTSATLSVAYTERAFQHWHVLPVAQELAAYCPTDLEVSALAEIGLRDAWRVAVGEVESVEAELSTRMPNGGWASTSLTVTSGSFVRNYLRVDEIFPRMFLAAENVLAGNSHVYW